MSGKTVSTALRGHFLVEAALTNKLVSNFLPQKRKENEIAENVEVGGNYEEENEDGEEQSEDEDENYEEHCLNGEDSTQETVNNIEPDVCSEKVLNEEEIRNLTLRTCQERKSERCRYLRICRIKEITEKFERFKE